MWKIKEGKISDSDNIITRGKKRQNKDDGKKTNTNTLVKGLKKKKHIDTKLDAIKDQDKGYGKEWKICEENKNWCSNEITLHK